MWSGPRNLSTTMMRSFGSRADTDCSDEPFYAAWLAASGASHPMRTKILASQPTDPNIVSQQLGAGTQPPFRVHYQKHMTHHFLPRFPRDWMMGASHVFLIRHPARVIASFARKHDAVTYDAIGTGQQRALFDEISGFTGTPPPLIDSDDILRDPETALQALCEVLSLPFDRAMLTWASGPQPGDGVWGVHWYNGVWASTGFGPASGEVPSVDTQHKAVFEKCLADYEVLAAHRLRV